MLLVLLAGGLVLGRFVAWPAIASGAPPPKDPIAQTRLAMRFVVPPDMASLVRGQGRTSGTFERVSDDYDVLSAEIPVDWQDIETREWTSGGADLGVAISASTSLDGFAAGTDPGVVIAATHQEFEPSAVAGILDTEAQQYTSGCQQARSTPFATAYYTGTIAFAFNCGGGPRNVLIVAAVQPEGGHVIVVRMSAFGQGDLMAAAHILDTVQVLGDPGHDDHDH